MSDFIRKNSVNIFLSQVQIVTLEMDYNWKFLVCIEVFQENFH